MTPAYFMGMLQKTDDFTTEKPPTAEYTYSLSFSPLFDLFSSEYHSLLVTLLLSSELRLGNALRNKM